MTRDSSRDTGEIVPGHENGGDWDEYRRLVLGELRRLERHLTDLSEQVSELRVEVARLNVKAGMWGALAGIVTAAAAVLLQRVGG
jgi:hypothetical protein